MNEDSTRSTPASSQTSVVKPWLATLVVAFAAYVLLAAVLIVSLGRFDESKRQADEAEARTATQRAELARLNVEVETLTKQKDVLAPALADWQQRLKEKSAAEAVLVTLEAKQQQAESEIAQAGKRLDEVNRALLEAEKQKTEVNSTVERLKSERDALAKSNTDAKVLARQAEEAEHRLNAATNALAATDTRRKQLEIDVAAAQSRFEEIQKDAENLRQAREKLTSDLAALRKQIQTQKDLLASFDQKAADLKVLQTEIGLEEQKVSKLQQQAVTAEARLEASKAGSLRADAEFGAAQKRIAETQKLQDELTSEQTKTIAQVTASKRDLEQSRKDAADAETRRDIAKADAQKADADLAAARAQLQVFVVKQGELTREVSRLDATIEHLKKEKETLEKEIGRQEAQRQKGPSEGQK